MIRSRLLRAGSLTACATLALLRAPTPPSTKRRTVHASSSSRTYLDDRYAHWRADVEAYEALEKEHAKEMKKKQIPAFEAHSMRLGAAHLDPEYLAKRHTLPEPTPSESV